MTEIGFAPRLAGAGWLGGVNYFRNLFSAVNALEQPKIRPLLLVRNGEEKAAKTLSEHVAARRLPWMLDTQSGRPARLLARAAPLSWMLWRRFLSSHRIGLLSHSPPVVPRALAPSLGIIFDLQHRELPEMFSQAERRGRDREFARLCRSSTTVVVSSEDALRALKLFFPEGASRARVLRFVANVQASAATPAEILKQKYDLPEAYFYLPNQFWKHKNHVTVLQALAALKRRGKDVVVVASGASNDYRDPEYYARLMRMVSELGIERGFRPLGVIPYADLLGLMRHCMAVINPSLYEGWSTTVEEAKSLGKLAILSRIAVHVEQNPGRSVYFDAQNAEELADCLVMASQNYSPATERKHVERARVELPLRMRSFGRAYQELVLEAMQD